MKKSLLMALAVMIMTACSAKDPKVLITYFSASGTTKSLSQDLAKATGADLFEIEGAQPYTADDVNLGNREARAFKEMADKSFRPELKESPKNLKSYDVVYIGFPIWGNAAPNIIYTFIEKNDLKGKTVIIFSTSGRRRRSITPARTTKIVRSQSLFTIEASATIPIGTLSRKI